MKAKGSISGSTLLAQRAPSWPLESHFTPFLERNLAIHKLAFGVYIICTFLQYISYHRSTARFAWKSQMHLGRRDCRSRVFAFHQSRLTSLQGHLHSLFAKHNEPTILLHHNDCPSFRTDRSYPAPHQLATTKALLKPSLLSQRTRNCSKGKIHLDKKFPYRDAARSNLSLNRA